MTGRARLSVLSCGPGVTVQDRGRPGLLAQGVSCGGAADGLALAEGAALLGQDAECACLEMAGMGMVLRSDAPVRIALTGAPMAATLEGRRLRWNASHMLPEGAELRIGAVRKGVYGYLHVGGGIATAPLLGSRATHLTAGLGRALAPGDVLPVGPDPGGPVDTGLEVADRTGGGAIDILPLPQTDLFDAETLRRLQATAFKRDSRGNRQGVRLAHGGAPFTGAGQLSLLSEIIQPGDIQMTGDGTPYILLADCQTTGGYPRIATVAPYDLPRVAQAAPGTALSLRFVDPAEACARILSPDSLRQRLLGSVGPLRRDPSQMPDLLRYRLIDGVVNAFYET